MRGNLKGYLELVFPEGPSLLQLCTCQTVEYLAGAREVCRILLRESTLGKHERLGACHRQETPHCSSVSFDRHAANAFQSYVSGALAFSIKRGGILYGSIDEEGKALVEVIYEPEQVIMRVSGAWFLGCGASLLTELSFKLERERLPGPSHVSCWRLHEGMTLLCAVWQDALPALAESPGLCLGIAGHLLSLTPRACTAAACS